MTDYTVSSILAVLIILTSAAYLLIYYYKRKNNSHKDKGYKIAFIIIFFVLFIPIMYLQY
jgi:uncharacterized membrane protein